MEQKGRGLKYILKQCSELEMNGARVFKCLMNYLRHKLKKLYGRCRENI